MNLTGKLRQAIMLRNWTIFCIGAVCLLTGRMLLAGPEYVVSLDNLTDGLSSVQDSIPTTENHTTGETNQNSGIKDSNTSTGDDSNQKSAGDNSIQQSAGDNSIQQSTSGNSLQQSTKNISSGESKPNILKVGDFPEIHPQICRRTQTLSDGKQSEDFMICVKPPKVDQWISGSIISSGIWEKNLLRIILHRLRMYPNATFIDLGANIGMFSLSAAAFGHSVISVDPVASNLAYIQKSHYLSGEKGTILYVQNTVSDVPSTLYPWNREPSNEGAMTFITAKEAQTKEKQLIGTPVHSVTFQEILNLVETDTVILKVDIEGYECKALSEFLSGKRKSRFIPFILMEWDIIGANRDNCCPNLKQFKQDFVASGYRPHDVKTLMQIEDMDKFKSGNVIWIHDKARGAQKFTKRQKNRKEKKNNKLKKSGEKFPDYLKV